MIYRPWLSYFLVKVYQLSVYSVFAIFLFSFMNLVEHSISRSDALWANPKIKVLFKPQLQRAIYYFSAEERKLHLSARVIGEYGERLSNVLVELSHPCFDSVTAPSDFDALINVSLNVKVNMSPHCKQNILDPLNKIKPIFSFKSSSVKQSNPTLSNTQFLNPSDPLPWSEDSIKKETNLDPIPLITFNVSVGKSIINSERKFTHDFKGQALELELELKPELYIYEKEHLQLVSKIISQTHLPKTLDLPVQDAVEVQLRLEKINNLNRPIAQKFYESKMIKEFRKSLKVNQELELSLAIQALENYRISYIFKWKTLPAIKVQSSIFKVAPQFRFKDIEIINSFWSSSLGLQGAIVPLGITAHSPRLQSYFQDLVAQENIRIKFAWHSFSSNTLGSDSNQLSSRPDNETFTNSIFDEKVIPVTQLDSWSQYFSLPKAKTVQLHAQLMTRDTANNWRAQGESFHSEFLVDTHNGTAIISLLLTYLLVFLVAYTLWYFYTNRQAKSPLLSMKSDNTLTLTRLSELNQPFLLTDRQKSFYICDALSHEILLGELTPISLAIFGSPQRWTEDFNTLLEQARANHMQTGSVELNDSTELIEGQLFWVTAHNYEPLLFQVPKGSGALIIPLWPCRFALTRIWNELFTHLRFEQNFGHGSIKDLKRAIRAQGGESLIFSFDLLAQDLYDGEQMTNEKFINALALLSAELDRLSAPNRVLYPPSDYQRIPNLESN